MRFTTTALCCLAFIIFLSISIAKISHVISVDIDNFENDENSYVFRGLKNDFDNGEGSDKFQLTVSDSSEHLLWFLQVCMYIRVQYVVSTYIQYVCIHYIHTILCVMYIIDIQYTVYTSSLYIFCLFFNCICVNMYVHNNKFIIIFIQISDIHISVFHDLSRVSDLKEFCRTTLDAIKPAVVLASG
jgi:hypothetical protein